MSSPSITRSRFGFTLSALPLLLLSFVVAVRAETATPPEERALDVAAFQAALDAQDDANALTLGETVFRSLQQKYRADAGFRAYEARLKAAEFLAAQMRQQLQRATNARLSAIAGEVFEGPRRASQAPSVAPARHFLETSTSLFAKPVRIEQLDDSEKTFLTRYYHMKLRNLVGDIARAGQALAIAEPSFQGTYDYVLVLPLLHASEAQPVSTAILPRWMRGPGQFRALSDSCLFSFEQPFSAMTIVRELAHIENRPFSEFDFYRDAAKRCGAARANVAVETLHRAAQLVPKEDADTHMVLSLEVIQLWLDSNNHELAAGEARRAFETYAEHPDMGKAVWLHYYALSRSNNAPEILRSIDHALENERYAEYRVRLMYVKWWALRSQRDQGAKLAAVEHELLSKYGDNPIVAPILLSRSTDLLASQAYGEARQLLSELVEKFPSTAAAKQAARMLQKLESIGNVR